MNIVVSQYSYPQVFGIYRANMPCMIICDLEMIKEICVKQFNNFMNRQTYDIEDPLGSSMTEIKGMLLFVHEYPNNYVLILLCTSGLATSCTQAPWVLNIQC